MDFETPTSLTNTNIMALPESTNTTDIDALHLLDDPTSVDKYLIDSYQRNQSIQNPAYTTLIAVYGCLSVLGAVGNILVVLVVARKPAMRTARNMFIVNLAVSDLLLCTVTMPLTLMEILAKYWPLGNHPWLCKMIGTLQATSIFVSTISITSIALDRYQVIVYPTRDNLQCMGAALILVGIWMLALLLASPMVMFKQLAHFNVNLHAYGIHDVVFCVEDWPITHGRAYYSAFSLFIQYLLPILIVSIAYSSIYGKLRNRVQFGVACSGGGGGGGGSVATASGGGGGGSSAADDALRERKLLRNRRMRRTNCMLVSIAVIFGVSWLPLNLFNLFSDIYLTNVSNTEPMLIAYAVCHMMGMSSACSNPFMYGWLNDNFRKEFREILCMRPQSGCLVMTTNHAYVTNEPNGRAASGSGGGGGGFGGCVGGSGSAGGGRDGTSGSGSGSGRTIGSKPLLRNGDAALVDAALGGTYVADVGHDVRMLNVTTDGCTENGVSTELTVLVQ